jgi:Flp pilus assembly protein TadG
MQQLTHTQPARRPAPAHPTWTYARWGRAHCDHVTSPAPDMGDRGSVALILAILTVGMLALAGLVIDGGAMLAARGRTADLAEQSARAGASAITPASLRGPSPAGLRIDPAAADRAASRVLAAGNAWGEVSVNTDTVTVTAHVSAPATLLSAFGIVDLTEDATATATLLHGTTTTGRP